MIGADRVAFTATVTFEDGRRIVESVIVEPSRRGRIVRQIDVEALA